MKKWSKVLGVVWGVVMSALVGTNAFADVNNFYFEDFTGDYYLSRVEDGTSKLKVVETVTAVFPDYKQNKGICRMIPFTNQAGANVTLLDLTSSNMRVMRNGLDEPIYSIEKQNDYYNICTGTEEHVLGKQIYTFEYEFEKVVTDFEDYQELYWDTNGTGTSQRFDKVTARVHFVGDVVDDYAGKSWCYVGKYGQSGQDRCTIGQISDGVEFVASGLKAYENLTFDVELKPESFVVPEPMMNYIFVWILAGTVAVVFAITIFGPLKAYSKEEEKRKYYQKMFVKPEYQPNAEYSVAEMAEVYIGKKKETKVAVLLDLIVRKRITLIKTGKSKKRGWKIKILDLDGVSEATKTMLAILNGGDEIEVGDEVEIKTQMATSRLLALGRKYDRQVVAELKGDGLVEGKYKKGSASDAGMGFVVMMVIVTGMFGMLGVMLLVDTLRENGALNGLVVGGEILPLVAVAVLVFAVALWSILYVKTEKYAVRTKKGLEASRYMDGVKLYIGMAEAERLKMLQSVEGADTSSEGIVRLYEKLLPYAAVLGLEDSWMEELEKYYKMREVTEPDWHRNGWTVRDMYYASMLASTSARSATSMSTGNGGSSSGFSGGGGGGFSGGGGGGGGFGGR